MATNNNDANSMLKVGTVLRGVYRIDDYLASGGFGNTYLATNMEFDEHVAIKEFYMKGVSLRNEDSSVSVSHPENVEMFDKLLKTFKREAKRLWKLSMGNAPHVVKVFDLFEENNTSYYVMQHINGLSLSGVLKASGKPLDEAWLMDSLLPQMLEALEAIHKNSMWHLDIKPSNIMIDDKGNAYLIDFGSSKQVDPASGNATLSSTLSFTRNYAPFEVQQYDLKKIGPWSDIYSLGATLYNLSTNQTPPTAYDIMNGGLSVFKFAPSASENFKNLLMWMMRNRTEDRPQNVAQIYSFLKTGKVPMAAIAPVAPVVPTRGEDTILRNAGMSSSREPKSRRGTAMSQKENKGNNKNWLLPVIGIIVGIFVLVGIGWAVYYLMSPMSPDGAATIEQVSSDAKDTINNIENKNAGDTVDVKAPQESKNVIHSTQDTQRQASKKSAQKGSNAGGSGNKANGKREEFESIGKSLNDKGHQQYDGYKKPTQKQQTQNSILDRKKQENKYD